MSTTASAERLDVEQLQERVRRADPSALLVPRRILRRVIRQHRRLAGPGLFVPHRKSYIIDRDALLQIAGADDLGVPRAGTEAGPYSATPPVGAALRGGPASLPDSVLLLAAPSEERLASSPPGQLLQRYWRLLFHAAVHREVQLRWTEGKLDEAGVRERAERIGAVEFEEITAVLRQDHFLFEPDSPASVYEEFAAVYLELRCFDRARLDRYFPGVIDHDAVDQLLAGDVQAEGLLERTRVEGADAPGVVPPPPAEEPVLPAPDDVGPPGALRARAEEVSRGGNQVRAAILRVQAVARAPASQAGALRGAARQDTVGLARRLQRALAFPERELDDWGRCLWALVEPAARGFWSGEARLLYDLQKVCLDTERPVFAADLVEWFVSGFRRPIKRPLPDLPLVLAVRNLRTARSRLPAARMPDADRRRLDELIGDSLTGVELRLRETLRPRIIAALDEVALTPGVVAERLARDRLVEELLDHVVTHGHLNMGNLRDALARNRLKLPDLSGPKEFLLGDPLIQANRALTARLDGVYHRGEIYLRWLQRFSSLFFGNRPGRALTLYLILPLLGAFFILKGIDGIAEELHKVAGLRRVETFPLPTRESFPWPHEPKVALAPSPVNAALLFAGLAAFLLALFHAPPFRQGVVWVLWCLWLAVRGVLYDVPAAALRLPLVQAALSSRPFYLFSQYLGKPLLWAAPVALLLYLTGAGPGWTFGVSAAVALFVSALINTPAGMIVEEGAYYSLARLWHAVSKDLLPGLFRFITWLSHRFIDRVQQALYTVDEWLRFRQGQNSAVFVVKTVLGLFWSAVTYVVRFVIVILVEPQINPIKHFPVVTVSHKLMLLLAPPVAGSLQPYLGWSYSDTLAVVILVLGLIPGMFGFLAWELKENWRLYRANQPKELVPQVVGSHGERVIHLVRPGFHSGTLPKLFARLRRAHGQAERKGESGLHHVEDDLRRFVERDLLAPLAASRAWAASAAAVTVGHLLLATNRIRVELCCPAIALDSLYLEFANRGGYLTARVAEPGWLTASPAPRAVFVTALTGFYKHAGVDLILEHVESLLPAGAKYEIRDDRLQVAVPGAEGVVTYSLLEPDAPAAGAGPDLPGTARPLLFRLRPVSWQAWVDRWEADSAGKDHEPPLLPGVTLLPAAGG